MKFLRFKGELQEVKITGQFKLFGIHVTVKVSNSDAIVKALWLEICVVEL